VSRRWASGGPRSPVTLPIPSPGPAGPGPLPSAGAGRQGATAPEAARDLTLAGRAAAITADWAPTAGRILLGVVFAWFGYHELLQPGQWTQYVPVISESSSLAIILVLAHGWVLLVLAAALVAGIAPRASAALASLLMLEIVISLAVTGLSDTALRDVGVLGLAVCLAGSRNQRLVLRD
jgi:uncharacterized membrane protein YphA (DoxX/SURF4 family)